MARTKCIVTAPMPDGAEGQQRFAVDAGIPDVNPDWLIWHLTQFSPHPRLKGVALDQIKVEGPFEPNAAESQMFNASVSGAKAVIAPPMRQPAVAAVPQSARNPAPAQTVPATQPEGDVAAPAPAVTQPTPDRAPKAPPASTTR